MKLLFNNDKEKIIDGSEDVCVAICIKNSASSISECVQAILSNKPGQIIVVDGQSIDGSIDLIEGNPEIEVLSDDGLGLARARRLAVEKAKRSLILFVGPDNILPENFLRNIVSYYKRSSFDAVSVQTRVAQPTSFWDYGQDFRWQCLMQEGKVKVLGTPSMYPVKLLQEVNFASRNFGPSDDTDLADRLLKMGIKLGIIPLTVWESGNQKFMETWQRYMWYGSGDYYYYTSRKETWSHLRRIKSTLHPARQFLKFSITSIQKRKLRPVLWLFITSLARYCGWIRAIL